MLSRTKPVKGVRGESGLFGSVDVIYILLLLDRFSFMH